MTLKGGISRAWRRRLRGVATALFLAGLLVMPLAGRPIRAAVGINKQISFQGKVVNSSGTNVADSSYSFVFSLYSASTGGVAIWTETKSITVTDGIFQTNLGSVTALPGSVDFNSDTIYLGVEFNSDGEMLPRVRLTAVPYAFNSDTLDGIEGADLLRSTASDTFEGTNSRTLTVQSDLTAGDRTANLLSITQASDVTSNMTAGALLGITNSDAGSAANLLSLSNSGTGAALLFAEGTSVANGIQWGTDTNLYRSAANTLKTDDALVVTGHTTFEGVTSTGATGTGKLVYDTSPTLVTPVLGAATYTTLSGGNITDSGLTSGRVTYAGTAGILQDSANLTFDGTTLTTAGLTLNLTQDYTFSARASYLTLQSQTAATAAQLELYSKDGDGTDGVANILFGVGSPADITNSEYGVFEYNVAAAAYNLRTQKGGTGTVRPLQLYTGANTTQVVLNIDGTTSFGGGVTATSVTDSGLTAGRVTYAGTAGILQDSANMMFDGTYLKSTGFNVGAATPAYKLDIRSATSASQVHIAASDADSGLYLMALNSNAGYFTSGVAWDGSDWIAKETSGGVLNLTGSNFGISFGSGWTVGNASSLTTVLNLTSSATTLTYSQTNTAFTALTETLKSTITATAAKNYIGEQITMTHAIAGGFSNTGTAPSYFYQNLRANTAGLSDTGSLTSMYGVNGNTGHAATDLYTNPLTTTAAGYGSTLVIRRGTITNSYTLLGAANAGISTPSAWAAGTVYALNTIVKPTVANGYYYIASVAGTSHATTEPTWPVTSTAGATPATIADNTVTWTELIIPAVTNEYGVYITSTTAHNYFGGNVGIGSTTTGSSRLRIAGAHSMSAWGTAGASIANVAATHTDTSSSGTVASAVDIGLATPTFAASAATTFTNAATLYIAAAPSAGTNVTLTKAWAQWVDSGDVRFDGNLTVGSTPLTTPVGNFDLFATTGGVATLGRNDTSVTANDVLGQIDFYSNDTSTTSNQNAARIQVIGTNTIATDINPGAMIFSTTPTTVAGALTEGFRIDNAQKLWIGGGAGLDTNLYRSAADTLYTDDSFTVATNLTVAGTTALQGATTESKVNAASGSADALTLSGTLGIFNGSDTFRGIYLNYTNANHTGSSNVFNGIDFADMTGDADATETGINVGTGWDYGMTLGLGGTAALNLSSTAGTAASGILFGADTTLYRGAASELRTDDIFTFSSSKAGTDTDFKTYKTVDAANEVSFIFDTSATVSTGSLFSVRNNGTAKFGINNNGNVVATGTFTTGTPVDIAENIAVLDQSIEAGDVVSVETSQDETVRKSVKGDRPIGVISTEPGVLMGGPRAGRPIALAGRVPVKVNDHNGRVRAGDLLIPSDVPGEAMRAGDETIMALGLALQPQGNMESDKVLVFLQFGSHLSPLQETILADQQLLGDGSLKIAKLMVDQLTINESISVNGQAVFRTVPIMPADAAGQALIATGQQQTTISFSRNYPAVPFVNATLSYDGASATEREAILAGGYSYLIGDRKVGGFTIYLNKVAASDLRFNWSATATNP